MRLRRSARPGATAWCRRAGGTHQNLPTAERSFARGVLGLPAGAVVAFLTRRPTENGPSLCRPFAGLYAGATRASAIGMESERWKPPSSRFSVLPRYSACSAAPVWRLDQRLDNQKGEASQRREICARNREAETGRKRVHQQRSIGRDRGFYHVGEYIPTYLQRRAPSGKVRGASRLWHQRQRAPGNPVPGG